MQEILTLDPGQPRALNALGLRMLATGDAARAAEFFGRATRADPRAVELWLNLANAQRQSGDDTGERASLGAVVAIEPYQVVALLQKAQNQERGGDRGGAARSYGAILSIVGTAVLPTAVEAALIHARRVIDEEQQALGVTIAPFIAYARASVAGPAARRFDRCVDVLLGRTRIYPSTPTGLSYTACRRSSSSSARRSTGCPGWRRRRG